MPHARRRSARPDRGGPDARARALRRAARSRAPRRIDCSPSKARRADVSLAAVRRGRVRDGAWCRSQLAAVPLVGENGRDGAAAGATGRRGRGWPPLRVPRCDTSSADAVRATSSPASCHVVRRDSHERAATRAQRPQLTNPTHADEPAFAPTPIASRATGTIEPPNLSCSPARSFDGRLQPSGCASAVIRRTECLAARPRHRASKSRASAQKTSVGIAGAFSRAACRWRGSF